MINSTEQNDNGPYSFYQEGVFEEATDKADDYYF